MVEVGLIPFVDLYKIRRSQLFVLWYQAYRRKLFDGMF